MPACKVCGHWFVKIKPKEELCDKCECALCRLSSYVAPVVRCKDCKQGEVDDPDFPDEYYCHAGCGWNNGDFYCAYGEKRRDKDGTT